MNIKQFGVSLMELLVSLAMSMVVVTSMVGLMANSMGATSRIIKMSQLSDELRKAMQLMTRDVRRANFNTNSVYCYANSDCGTDGSAAQSSDVIITDNQECFVFNLDRNWDGDASNDGAGGFRRTTSGGVGFVEMWVGGATLQCAANSSDWVAITDPDFVDITTFTIDDSASFSQSILEEGGSLLTQRTRQVQIQIEGRLILDNSITRRIEDTIKLRNDFYL